MKKLFKYFPWITSGYLLVSHVIGLAGTPGDIETWQKWINITFALSMKTTISQNLLQWIFLISGLLILVIYSDAHKRIWHKFFRPKRDLSTGSVLIEDEEIINDTLSPLKIEVQEDGIAYFRVEDEKRHSLQGSKRQVLSIRVHSKEAVDDVKIYISEIETSYDKDALQNLLPIPLNFKDANTCPVSLSADESRQVDVVSYSSGLKACELELEQFGSEDNPKVFMYGSPFCLKTQIKIYGNKERLSQQDFEIFMKEPLEYNYASNSTQRIFMKCISKEQQDTIDSQRKTIESLKEQERRKLEVTFEKGNKPYFQKMRFTSPISQRDGQLHTYRIRVKNIGLEIIKNVNVKLTKVKDCPENFFAEGCNLQFMHNLGVKAKDIQPEDEEFVDIIGYFDPYNKDIETKEMYIFHTAGGKLKSNIPVRKYDITIKINSDNGGKFIIKNIKFTPTRKNIEDFMEMD